MQDFKELDEEDKCVMLCNKTYPYLWHHSESSCKILKLIYFLKMRDLYFSGIWSCTTTGHEVAWLSLGSTENKESQSLRMSILSCQLTSIIYFPGFHTPRWIVCYKTLGCVYVLSLRLELTTESLCSMVSSEKDIFKEFMPYPLAPCSSTLKK